MKLPPTTDEVRKAIAGLKLGKAAGADGVLPEMLRYGGEVVVEWLVSVMARMWSGGAVTQEWCDALMVPVPKKGDLTRCDNWRGISLLEVAGKVFAKTLQSRLQQLAEERVLPESQCGFRKGRGCADMSFAARMVVEKVREHNDKAFLLFVDLTKAYDSVARSALWKVLEKLGVPSEMVKMVRSLHEGMKAEVRVGEKKSGSIKVNNGLRQGCTLAPTLFNIYFSMVISDWRARCKQLGLAMATRNTKSLKSFRPNGCSKELLITELMFADDAAAVVRTREGLEEVARLLVAVAGEWGLTVSLKKTEFMVVGKRTEADMAPIVFEGEEVPIKHVSSFKYLGSVLTEDGRVEAEVRDRIVKAARAFGVLRPAVFDSKDLTTRVKRMVYKAAVWGTLLYGAESWATTQKEEYKLEAFHNRCLRSMAGISTFKQQEERITSAEIRKRMGFDCTLREELRSRRLRWLGHVARMDEMRLPKLVMFSCLHKPRPVGGTKQRWRDRVHQDLKEVGVGQEEWYTRAQDRVEWRKVVIRRGSLVVKPTLVCPRCRKECKGKGGLSTHSRFCKGGGGLRENEAGEIVTEETVARLEGDGEGWVWSRRCKQCGVVCKSGAGLMRHSKVCGKARVKPKRLSETDRSKLSDQYACNVCARKMKSEGDLRRHTSVKHRPPMV